MLLKMTVLERIRAGDVSLVFRRWRRPTVKAGGQLRTAVGMLRIVDVRQIRERDLSSVEAIAAGFPTRRALVENLAGHRGQLYRVEVAYDGVDPRLALRENDALSESELQALLTRLERMDRRSSVGPWTAEVLEVIARHPNVAARTLAERLRCERDWLKPNVRKLKNLGLTISQDPGYALSPRGRVVLTHLRSQR